MGQYQSKDLFAAIETEDVKKVKKIVRKTKLQLQQSLNMEGITPLQLASKRGMEDISKVLMGNGYDANTPDGKCWFPLHYACDAGNMGMVKILTSEEYGPHKGDVNNQCKVNECKCDKQTALHVACKKGYLNCVIVLLSHKADVALVDNHNLNAYDIAVKYKHTEIAEKLKPYVTFSKKRTLLSNGST